MEDYGLLKAWNLNTVMSSGCLCVSQIPYLLPVSVDQYLVQATTDILTWLFQCDVTQLVTPATVVKLWSSHPTHIPMATTLGINGLKLIFLSEVMVMKHTSSYANFPLT